MRWILLENFCKKMFKNKNNGPNTVFNIKYIVSKSKFETHCPMKDLRKTLWNIYDTLRPTALSVYKVKGNRNKPLFKCFTRKNTSIFKPSKSDNNTVQNFNRCTRESKSILSDLLYVQIMEFLSDSKDKPTGD